ncbi:MAG: putative lipid II flippase FtsW [Burkholderiaceae bacterium]
MLSAFGLGRVQQKMETPASRRLLTGGQAAKRDASLPVDEVVIWIVAVLLMVGIVMVYSSTIAAPDSRKFSQMSSTSFLLRHLVFLTISFTAGLIAFAIPVAFWEKHAPKLFVVGVLLLVIVLIPGVSEVTLGARRRIPIGPVNIQPSELMKLFVILYAANYTVRKREQMRSFKKGILPIGLAVSLVGVLLLREPDLGALVVICAIASGMVFLGGIKKRLFLGVILFALTTFALAIMFSQFRRERLLAYLDPFSPDNITGKGYQLSRSLIAFDEGGWFGVGLGASVQKLEFLPEPHTDFVLAVIGEELGLMAVLVLILLFFWLTRRLFEIGRQAIALDRIFAGLVAYGVGLWFVTQAFIHMGVNLGLLPTKGLTLPFISYGGSSMVATIAAVAIVLRVDFESRRLMRGLR